MTIETTLIEQLTEKYTEEYMGKLQNVLPKRLNYYEGNPEDFINALEDVIENTEGVYVRWNDTTWSSEDRAIEVLMEDKNAVEASFKGWLEIDDFPYMYNQEDGHEEHIAGYVGNVASINLFLHDYLDSEEWQAVLLDREMKNKNETNEQKKVNI